MPERRRKYERVGFLATAWVRVLASQNRFKAHVTSLSRGGLGLFSEGFAEVGEAIEIELTWTGSGGRVFHDRLEGAVVAAQVGIDGNVLGVRFKELLGTRHEALMEQIRKAQQSED